MKVEQSKVIQGTPYGIKDVARLDSEIRKKITGPVRRTVVDNQTRQNLPCILYTLYRCTIAI